MNVTLKVACHVIHLLLSMLITCLLPISSLQYPKTPHRHWPWFGTTEPSENAGDAIVPG